MGALEIPSWKPSGKNSDFKLFAEARKAGSNLVFRAVILGLKYKWPKAFSAGTQITEVHRDPGWLIQLMQLNF